MNDRLPPGLHDRLPPGLGLPVEGRNIQKGPSFPQPLDITVVVLAGQVTWCEVRRGRNEVKTEHIELPPDLANDTMSLSVENFPAKTVDMTMSYVAVASKPRVVRLSMPDGEDRAFVGGPGRRAPRFNVHVEIGSLAGAIAPAIGKQPSDTKLWIPDGAITGLIKMEGALYEKGPIWTMVPTSPAWPLIGSLRGQVGSTHSSGA